MASDRASNTAREPSQAWVRAFARLAMNDAFELPQLSLDGTWVTRCTASMAPLGRVLSHLPGTYLPAEAPSDGLDEATGTSDDGDTDRGLFYCDAERAIVTYTDHWQAGLFAAVATYATEAQYREALAAASTSTERDVTARRRSGLA